MEQRDYLLRQIEMMAQFLAALIRRITGLKDEGSDEELQKTTNEMLQEQLGINLEEIANKPLEELPAWLAKEKGVHQQNIELFAQLLHLNAEAMETGDERTKILEAALRLYQWINEKGDTFSIQRHQKMNEITNLLNS